MATNIKSIHISSDASKTLQKWIREVNLHDWRGKPVHLKKACELIIEDFAEVLSKDEKLLAEEFEMGVKALGKDGDLS